MNIPCTHCGAMLQRPPSRIAANAQQFCNFRCLGTHRARPVTLTCAVCEASVTVKASRATQNNAITCSPACVAELRRRNQVALHDSAERRVTACAECGKTVTRKPSQIERYPTTFCNRSCKARYMSGPRPEQETGEWVPCEVCSTDVWRTPATRREHVFCSRKCAGRAGEERPNHPGPGLFGPKNPWWKGGTSLYAPGWTLKRSREIRARDGYTCQICSAVDGLIVHHVDQQKVDHSDANLITLCRGCHRRVHSGILKL